MNTSRMVWLIAVLGFELRDLVEWALPPVPTPDVLLHEVTRGAHRTIVLWENTVLEAWTWDAEFDDED
jgi:hypothetical protein